jgi:hypothetical protein
MRAVVTNNDGSRFVDMEHVLKTVVPEQDLVPSVQVSSTETAPSLGVEMLALVNNGSGPNNQFQVAAEDLQGNLICYYNDPSFPPPSIPNPVKLLRDGSVLINFDESGGESGLDSILRDIDLAGNTNCQITAQDLAQSLSAKGCFSDATIIGSSHDFAELPNDHLIVIINLLKSFTNLAGSRSTGFTHSMALRSSRTPALDRSR